MTVRTERRTTTTTATFKHSVTVIHRVRVRASGSHNHMMTSCFQRGALFNPVIHRRKVLSHTVGVGITSLSRVARSRIPTPHVGLSLCSMGQPVSTYIGSLVSIGCRVELLYVGTVLIGRFWHPISMLPQRGPEDIAGYCRPSKHCTLFNGG